ncbi:MAG: TIGR02556 family CRISPR-associated protein [Candidatus Bathyarchaeota archaeon]|nr:TIGR02556 family CRISPR-associated protein [Candidatus Bathyarchaeota archaeon]
MIEAIYTVGVYSLHNRHANLDDAKQVTEILCEDPQSSDLYKTIITVELNKKGEDITFCRVGKEKYTSEKTFCYLYRRGGSNGSDFSPTCRLTEPKKTVTGKFFKWFYTDFSDPSYGLTEEEQAILTNIKSCILSNSKQILEAITTQYLSLKNEKQSGIITIVLHDKGGKKYLGDISEFKKILRANALASYSHKFNKISKSKNQICTICREKRAEVYGFVSTYNFYTVDKPGMVSGGFDQSKAWKNYPVCRNCALTLEEGKKFLDENATFRFYGFDYLLIPKSLTTNVTGEVYEPLQYYHEKGAQIRLTKEYKKLLDETEGDIFDYLSGKPNTFQCIILIYAASNNEFKILRYIEGVFPSRLRELFKAKEIVDQNQYFKEFPVKVYEKGKQTGEKPLEFNFGSFWHFFGKRKDEDKSAYFLDIVAKVFQNEKVSYRFFLNGVVNRIRKQFAQGYSTKEDAMRGLCSLAYLQKLCLLCDYNQGDNMNGNKIREIINDPKHQESTQKLDAIFDGFPEFFNRNSTRAIFSVGALAQLLIDIQCVVRGTQPANAPFRTKLQGLRLDQRKVSALLPEIQNKFEEYNKNYYKELEKFASEYLIQAGNDWELSKDEVSFYFVLGMNLASYLKQSKEVKNDE